MAGGFAVDTVAGCSNHPNPSHPIRGSFAVGCASTASGTGEEAGPDGCKEADGERLGHSEASQRGQDRISDGSGEAHAAHLRISPALHNLSG